MKMRNKLICLSFVLKLLIVSFAINLQGIKADPHSHHELSQELLARNISYETTIENPSYTRGFALYQSSQHIPPVNASDGRITGGPSITQSLAAYRAIQKRYAGDAVYKHKNANAVHGYTDNPVAITCINPTVSRIDECIESMDAKVAEMCLPGLMQLLNHLHVDERAHEIKSGRYAFYSNKSETCLRYVFSNCSYDSRYKVKTKIRKLIGINLDIAFQKEFEMDCCNKHTMNEVLTNAHDCLQKQKKDFHKFSYKFHAQATNLSREILDFASECIEDHTAFTCLLKNRTLFRETIKDLVMMLKTQSLGILETLSADKSNYTRLCLKLMDYNRLEGCENHFFEYVLSLKNGLYKAPLFKDVHLCFQNALKVCPADTVEKFISIAAGAVEGHEGMEPPPTDDNPMHSYHKVEYPSEGISCNEEITQKWIHMYQGCVEQALAHDHINLKRLGEICIICAKKVGHPDCNIDKASQFIDLSEGVAKLVPAGPQSIKLERSKEEDAVHCLQNLENPKVKECIVNLFLYYISLSHAHYTPDGREKLLVKAKLCFQVTLKACPFKTFIEPLFITYSIIFGFKLPYLGPSGIITRVTIPEGYVWCETRIVTGKKPLPPTQEMNFGYEGSDFEHKVTRTTVGKEHFSPHVETWKEMYPGISVHTEYYKPHSRLFTKIITPTTVRHAQISFFEKKWTKVTFPAPLTRSFEHKPTRRTRIYWITPSTVKETHVYPRERTMKRFRPAPVPSYYTYTPNERIFKKIITPTTVLPYTRRVMHIHFGKRLTVPTTRIQKWHRPTMKYTKYLTRTTTKRYFATPAYSVRKWGKMVHGTVVFTETARPKIKYRIVTPTTVAVEEYPITAGIMYYTHRPVFTRKEIFEVPGKMHTLFVPGYRTKKYHFPIHTWKEFQHDTVSTTKVAKYEVKRKRVTGAAFYTTRTKIYRKIYKKGKEYYEHFTPTTTAVYGVKPKVFTERGFLPAARTEHYTYEYERPVVEKYITPTRVLIERFTVPGHREVYQNVKPVVTTILYYRPQVKHFTGKRGRTIVKSRRYTIKPEIYERKGKRTTVKSRVIEIGTHAVVGEKGYVTSKVYYPRHTRVYEAGLTRTTTRKAKVPIKKKVFESAKGIPQARTFHYPGTYRIYKHFKPRTTVIQYIQYVKEKFVTMPLYAPRPRKMHYPGEVYTESILPSPAIAERYKIPGRRFQHAEHETTLRIIMIENNVVRPQVREERLPTTVRYIVKPGFFHKQRITPTTFIVKKFTQQISVKKGAYPGQVIYYTQIPHTPMFKRIFAPGTSYYELPFTELPFYVLKPQVHTVIMKYYPKTHTAMERRVYPTKTYVARRTFKVHTYRQMAKPTTMRIVIMEAKSHAFGKTAHTLPTKFEKHAPQQKYFTQELPRFTYRTFYRTVTPIIKKKFFKVPATKIYHVQRQPAIYVLSKPRTEVYRYDVAPHDRIYKVQYPQEFTKLYTFTVPQRYRTQRYTRTEVVHRKVHLPTGYFHEEGAVPTTLRIMIMEIPEKKFKEEKEIPVTHVYYITPEIEHHVEHVTPTIVLRRKVQLPTKRYKYFKKLPRTTEVSYQHKEQFFEREMIPSQVFVVEYTVTGRPIYKFITLAATKSFAFAHKDVRPEYEEHRTPTTTVVYEWSYHGGEREITQHVPHPVTKLYKKVPRPMLKTHRIPVVTEKIEFERPHKEYECEYPPPKPPVINCETFTYSHVEDECSDVLLNKWIKKIRGCTIELLHEDNIKIEEFLLKRKVKELEGYVTTCMGIIGDTRCRNSSFPLINWVLEKEVYVMGGLKEHAEHESEVNDDLYHNMHKCVALIEEAKMESCYPGFYKAITDIVLFKKHDVVFGIEKKEHAFECLTNSLSHCTHRARVTLEKVLLKTFGKCIMLSNKEKSICGRVMYLQHLATPSPLAASGCVYYSTIENILGRVTECIFQAGDHVQQQYPLPQVIVNVLSCISQVSDDNECVYSYKEEDIKMVQGLLERLAKHAVDDKCKEDFHNSRTKRCFQNLVDVSLTLYEVQEKEKLVATVHRCFVSAMPNCPDSVPNHVIIYMLNFISYDASKLLSFENDGAIYPTISSIKKFDSGLELCVNGEGEYEYSGSVLRPSFPDECVQIYNDLNPHEPLHILMKGCNDKQVDKWQEQLKGCAEEKSTKIGLRDPDYLNLHRVAMFSMNCVDKIGPLKCRAKYQGDFQKLLMSTFNMLKYNSLSESNQDCMNQLRIDGLQKCFHILHKYLALVTDQEQLNPLKEKSLHCVSSSLKSCPGEFQEKLLNLLELAMIPDAESIRRYHKGYEKCSPAGYGYEEGPDKSKNAESEHDCGPGGILVRKTRQIHKEQSSDAQKSAHLKKEFGDSRASEISITKSDRELTGCTSAEYKRYFEQMKECVRRRLYLKFRRTRHKCRENDMIESWTAMTECMVENIGDELTCLINTEAQMAEYLYYVAEASHMQEQITRSSCPSEARCYGNDVPKMHKCSVEYLQLVKARESDDHLFQILNRTFRVLDCLRSVWPHCSPKISFMALSFVYLPLGMNYNITVSQGLNFATCKVGETVENSTYPGCMGHGKKREIQSNYSAKSVKDCGVCVKVKDGICSTRNVSDTIQVVKEDFTRMADCLKAYVTNDDCLQDVTIKMRKNCVREFYGFVKNMKRGVVLNSVEHFWKFNNCLTNFKTECPESFKQFVPEVYYESLGLGSSFKPLIQIFADSIQ